MGGRIVISKIHNLSYDAEEFYDSDAWLDMREEILERDEYTCQVCGATKHLQVHHIVPRKYIHVVSWDIDREENLITLCKVCHSMSDRKVDNFGNRIGENQRVR